MLNVHPSPFRVVVGDLLLLKPGQELCADVRLCEVEAGPTRRIALELDEGPLDALRQRYAHPPSPLLTDRHHPYPHASMDVFTFPPDSTLPHARPTSPHP